MRSGNLSLDDRNGHGEEANTQALNSTTGDKSCESWCKHLNEGAEEVDEASEANCPFTTNHVTETTSDEGAHCGRGLQASDRDARDRRVHSSCAAVRTTIFAEEPFHENRVDKKSGHNT